MSGTDVEAVGSARWPGAASSVTEPLPGVTLACNTVSPGLCSFLGEEIYQPAGSFAQTLWVRK